MQSDASRVLAATFLLYWIPPCVCYSRPGRPKLTGCRSSDKETFSCWWEPGSTGGLPTTHHLFYKKEGSEKVFECPDYQNNSCYFNKAHTSIWMFYNITVMASNSYGNTFSDPVEVDVMDIVQPYSPENMSLSLMVEADNPYFLVKWEAPHDIDTRSGWVTLRYEVRVKQDHAGHNQVTDWEIYSVGKQRELSIFSPKPGGNYTIQVRCKLDEGLWSEWNSPMFIQMPNNSENSVLIFIAIISGFISLVTTGALIAKRKHVKHFLLPPVPGPKITDFDRNVFKTVKPEFMCNTLDLQGRPMTECPEQVEYLMVLDSEEDSENPGSKTCEESHAAHQNTSDQKAWNKWKLQGVSYKCQDSDPEFTASNSSIYSVPKPDIYQNGPWVISHKNNVCVVEQTEDSVTPAGLRGYAEQKQMPDCRPKLSIKQEEDYSKVSGIYRETVLMIQKDNSPVQGHKKRNRNDLNKKITQSAEDPTDIQEYVASL
ncbi:prolactin receptor [Bagarius yarrelli]|uniref:Prolactin receptor n=1 Tax=Bagarius yarrelli TaxID=175774 RepID=A0A556U5D3_BAGYA|nr:prolactin receptor [Bagarius yarrelli]